MTPENTLTIDNVTSHNFSIWNNPVEDEIKISGLNPEIQISIYSVSGALIFNKPLMENL